MPGQHLLLLPVFYLTKVAQDKPRLHSHSRENSSGDTVLPLPWINSLFLW